VSLTRAAKVRRLLKNVFRQKRKRVKSSHEEEVRGSEGSH